MAAKAQGRSWEFAKRLQVRAGHPGPRTGQSSSPGPGPPTQPPEVFASWEGRRTQTPGTGTAAAGTEQSPCVVAPAQPDVVPLHLHTGDRPAATLQGFQPHQSGLRMAHLRTRRPTVQGAHAARHPLPEVPPATCRRDRDPVGTLSPHTLGHTPSHPRRAGSGLHKCVTPREAATSLGLENPPAVHCAGSPGRIRPRGLWLPEQHGDAGLGGGPAHLGSPLATRGAGGAAGGPPGLHSTSLWGALRPGVVLQTSLSLQQTAHLRASSGQNEEGTPRSSGWLTGSRCHRPPHGPGLGFGNDTCVRTYNGTGITRSLIQGR